MVFVQELFKKIFSWLPRVLPWILVAGGTVSLGIGIYLPSSTISQFSITFGTAVLSSGTFAAIAKSAQFTDIFRTVVDDVVWGSDAAAKRQEQFKAVLLSDNVRNEDCKTIESVLWGDHLIKKRNDLDKLWIKVFNIYGEERFPGISDGLASVINQYSQKQQNYYFSRADRRFSIKSISDDGATLLVIQRAELELIPYPGAAYIDYEHTYTGSSDASYMQNVLQVIQIDNNGNEKEIYASELSNYGKTEDKGDGIFSSKYNLPSAKKYRISRTSTHKIKMFNKPYLRVFSKTFVENLTVEAIVECNGIRCRFESFGTPSTFTDVPMASSDDGRAHFKKRYSNLLLPKQGFMLTFIRLPSQSEGAA